jgi:hypothetical protein
VQEYTSCWSSVSSSRIICIGSRSARGGVIRFVLICITSIKVPFVLSLSLPLLKSIVFELLVVSLLSLKFCCWCCCFCTLENVLDVEL